MDAVRQSRDCIFITWIPSKGQGLSSYQVQVKVMDQEGAFDQVVVSEF